MVRRFIQLLPIIALLLLAPACHEPTMENTVEVIDLLELLPPAATVDYAEPKAPALTWDCKRGLPSGWTAGPEGVEVKRVDGGIRLVSPDRSAPWVEKRITIDAYRYYALLAVVKPEAGPPARLYHSFTIPPYFHASNKFMVTMKPERDQQTLRFELPAPPVVDRPVKALRLYPGARRRSVLLKKIILQPRRENFIGRHTLTRDRIELGQDFRRCWRLGRSGIREATVTLPDTDATLTCALGTLRGEGRGRLNVTVAESNRDGTTIWSGPFPTVDAGWREAKADLSRWRGKRVTLRFDTTGSESAVRLIASPRVRTGPPNRRPSVLLIALDAQRADRLSVYGHDSFTSPHLDRMAREGVLFTSATAPCSWTIPSVISTLTGKYTEQNRIARGNGEKIGEVTTLAERFSGAGYITGGFAANFLLTWNQGFADGFSAWYVAPHRDVTATAEAVNSRVVEWLGSHQDEETFCYVHYMDPHDPYDAPWPAPAERSSHPTGGMGSETGWEGGNLWPLVIGGKKLDSAGIEQVGRNYDRGTAYTDHHIGCLLAILRREGLLENTVVLVTADHGDELHDHGYWSHGTTLYQEVIHVPMLIHRPRPESGKGRIVHAPVSLVDVAPTLTTLASLPDEHGWSDGRNMLDLPPEPRIIYSNTMAHAPTRFAVIRPPWKYIHFDRAALAEKPPETAQGRWLVRQDHPSELLFNLETDPDERFDLAEERPQVMAEMRGLMSTWFTESGGTITSEDATLSPDERKRLLALGYIQE